MNPRLITLYDRELQYLREKTSELVHHRPDTAGKLGLSRGAGKAQDAHVERLLEGVAFLAARVHQQLEAGFPQVAQSLAETIYPALSAPLPACSIVQFQPGAELNEEYVVKRDSELYVTVVSDPKREISTSTTACEFRTVQPVTVLPIELTEASYTDGHSVGLDWGPAVASSIRFRLRHLGGRPLSDLSGWEELTFYIRGLGGGTLAPRVYELIMREPLVQGYLLGSGDKPYPVPGLKLSPVGFADEEALLPAGEASFAGFRLLREFFAFPARFMFFRLSGLNEVMKHCDGPEVELHLGLATRDAELEPQINHRCFALHCTPAINLFPATAEVSIEKGQGEFEVVPDVTRRLDFETCRVLSVAGNEVGRREVQEFLPFFHPSSRSEGGRSYFSVRRQARVVTRDEVDRKSIPNYLGGEVFLSLVDPQCPPFSPKLSSLSVGILASNRHLPARIPLGPYPVQPPTGCPVSAHFLSERSDPQGALLGGELTWRVISHLSVNYFSLVGGPPGLRGPSVPRDARVLREMLRVYSDILRTHGREEGARTAEGWIAAIDKVSTERITRFHPELGASALVSGLAVSLLLRERPLQEIGLFLFGTVLEQFLRRFASINTSIELVLRGDQRGEIKRWKPRTGQRMPL